MLEDSIKIKEQKIFQIIFCLLVIIGGIILLLFGWRDSVCDDIFKMCTTFGGDFWPAITYGTSRYTIDIAHAYPPFMNLLYMLFGKFIGPQNENIWWRPIIAILYNFFPIVLTYKIIRKKIVNYKPIFALMLSLPGAYFTTLRSGNSAYIFNIFTLFFILYYNSEDKTKREISILSLAIAISTRLVPAVFGFLLIVDKRYKDIIKLVIYCAVLFFIPLIFTVTDISYIEKIRLFFKSLFTYNDGEYNTIGRFSMFYIIFGRLININMYLGEKIFIYRKICEILTMFLEVIISLIMLINCIINNSYFKKILSLCFVFMVNSRTTYHSYVIFVIPLIIYFNEKETKINLIILIIYILAVFSPISYFFISHKYFIVTLHSIFMDSLYNILLLYFIFDFFKEKYSKNKVITV